MQNPGNSSKILSLPSMKEQVKEHSRTKKTITYSLPLNPLLPLLSSGLGVVWMYTMLSGRVRG